MADGQQQSQLPRVDVSQPNGNGEVKDPALTTPLLLETAGAYPETEAAEDEQGLVSSSKLSPWALHRVKSRFKDRLHEAQESLLKKDEEKQSTYAAGNLPVQRTSWKTPSEFSIHSPIAPESYPPRIVEEADDRPRRGEPPLSILAGAAPEPMLIRSCSRKRGSLRRIHSNPDSLGESAKLQRLASRGPLTPALALIGLDWYQLEQKQHKLSWLFILQNLYYWCYLTYIVSLITFGGLLMWLFEPDGRLTFTESFYSAAACVTQSGLSVVDWSKQSTSTYIVSFCLILGGSAPLLHLAPVILRRSSFRKQKRLAEKWCAKQSDTQIPAATAAAVPAAAAVTAREAEAARSVSGLVAAAKATLGRGMTGNWASKEETEEKSESATIVRRHTFSGVHEEDLFCRGVSEPNFCTHEREDSLEFVTPDPLERSLPTIASDLTDMHDLEYQALGMVVKIVLGYWICAHAVGCSIFFCYFHFGSGDIQDKFHAEGLSSHWHAIYLAVSSFQNNGLVMTPSSVMDFARSPILLNTIATLIILGNTGLPIMVRLIASALRRRAVPLSDSEQVLGFLLEHPRRCFTHMFPAVHTLWLLLVVLTLNLTTTAVLLWQDAESQAMNEYGPSDSFFNALFQAVSARTCGLNSINIAQLSQGSTFFLCVMMYLATTPTVVTMRFSQISAGNPGELDITGRAEGIEEDVIKGDNSLKTQARRYLTQDITYLVVLMFVILVLEKKGFEKSAAQASPNTDGIYGDFNFFKVFFEMTSAYGTVGYSLGFENQSKSFSGVWCSASQYLLVVVMVMGRVRGLPDSIDPSVRAAMQHSEGKHHAFVAHA